jgi:ribosomal silencing factor RsfS
VHVFDEIDREYYDLEHLWSVPASRPVRATQGLSSEA